MSTKTRFVIIESSQVERILPLTFARFSLKNI